MGAVTVLTPGIWVFDVSIKSLEQFNIRKCAIREA